MKLTLIIPCHNEAGNSLPLFQRFAEMFGSGMKDLEFIYIDDGSTDSTLSELRALENKSAARVRIISFSRKFGKEAALLAGLRLAEGEYTGIIDGDGQQDPKYIRQMLELLEKDSSIDCAAAYQKDRKESFSDRFFKHHFYLLMNRLCSVELKEAASDFRVFNRRFRDAVLSLPELCRFSKGIFSWVGFRTQYIDYEVGDRLHGKSNWSFGDLFRYAVVGIVAFSTKPLVIASVTDGIYTAVSFIAMIYVFIKALIFGDPAAGYPTIMCVLLLSFGLLFLFIGILGSYLANVYIETKHRPPYLTDRIYDSEEKDDSHGK